MKGKRTLVVEIPADELRLAILEGMLGLTKPANQSASLAFQLMQQRSPEVAEMAIRAADRAMLVIADCAKRGSTVQ